MSTGSSRSERESLAVSSSESRFSNLDLPNLIRLSGFVHNFSSAVWASQSGSAFIQECSTEWKKESLVPFRRSWLRPS